MSMTKQILLETILLHFRKENCDDVQKIVNPTSSCKQLKKKKKKIKIEDALGNNKMDSKIFNWSPKE